MRRKHQSTGGRLWPPTGGKQTLGSHVSFPELGGLMAHEYWEMTRPKSIFSALLDQGQNLDCVVSEHRSRETPEKPLGFQFGVGKPAASERKLRLTVRTAEHGTHVKECVGGLNAWSGSPVRATPSEYLWCNPRKVFPFFKGREATIK